MISAKNLKPTKPFVKAGQATETVNLHALITCPFSQKAFCFWEVKMDKAQLQADIDAAEDALRAVRATLTDSQWTEFLFLAHCEFNNQQAVEVEKWNGALHVLDSIARGSL